MSVLNNLAIKTKTALFTGVLVLVVMFSAATAIYVEQEQKVSFDKVFEASHAITEKVIPLSLTIKDINLNIVQVQQWLTDISATRALDGLNDGYDAAQEQATLFKENVSKASNIARELGLEDVQKSLSAVKEAFPPLLRDRKKDGRSVH